jgi:hypothetical protein
MGGAYSINEMRMNRGFLSEKYEGKRIFRTFRRD